MEILLLVGIIAVNVFISWRNCVTAGAMWKDAMGFGTGMDKALVVSAAVQASIGFSMPFVFLFGWIATGLLSGRDGPLDAYDVSAFWQSIFSLWYVAIILPALGTGTLIWIDSIRRAYHERSLASFLNAGWNTFAQVHNALGAVRNIGPAISNVGQLFKPLSGRGGGKGKAVLLVIIVVILALAAGCLIAFALIRHYAATRASRLEILADELKVKDEGTVFARGTNADGSHTYSMG